MKIIVLNNSLTNDNKETIKTTAKKAKAEVCFVSSEDDIPESFKDADVLYGFGMKTAKTSKDLKWLCVPSAGVDYLMKPGMFANRSLIVSNSAGAYGVAISEHIIAVSLMLMRRLHEFYDETSNGIWGPSRPQRSLKDCRITVLGTGDIGRCFAKRARAFEPQSLIGVSRSGVCKEDLFDKMYKIDDLDSLLPNTDLLVMSLPDTPRTRNVITKKQLDLLPDEAFLINVGRGSAIDEEALIESLENGKLAGASLDVFVSEPLPSDSRMWNTKNLIITPHIAGNLTVDHTRDRNVEMFCEDLINYANGRPLKYRLDMERGY